MNIEEQTISNYYSLNPVHYRILVRLELRQEVPENAPPNLFMEVELRPDGEEKPRLLLLFDGVREARIEQSSFSVFEFPLIEVSSIRDRQWEDLNYKVRSEDETLLFLCRSFEAVLKD